MTLTSWNDTKTKQAVLDFVASTADENSPDYIVPAERIAAFDNDGTLWVEQPAPAQTGITLRKDSGTGQSRPIAGCRRADQVHR